MFGKNNIKPICSTLQMRINQELNISHSQENNLGKLLKRRSKDFVEKTGVKLQEFS